MDYNEFNEKFPLNVVVEEVSNIDEACWKGYKQFGMKKKGEKEVPNCVKESDKNDEDGENKPTKKQKSKVDLEPKLDISRV